MESPKIEGERLPVEGTSDLSAGLGAFYGFAVVKPRNAFALKLGPPLCDSWPWPKRWAFKAWWFAEEYIVPPLLLALAITFFRIALIGFR